MRYVHSSRIVAFVVATGLSVASCGDSPTASGADSGDPMSQKVVWDWQPVSPATGAPPEENCDPTVSIVECEESGGGGESESAPPPESDPQWGVMQNPWNCQGQTDNPHKSTHVPGTVNVVARSSCGISVPTIRVITALQRWNFPFWSTVGNSPLVQSSPGSYVQTNAAATCVTDWYRGVSGHSVVGPDGFTYGLNTKNQEYVVC